MKEKHQLYEGMYILNATLSEDARKKALDRITSSISERGGEVHKVHDEGKKKLEGLAKVITMCFTLALLPAN